MAGKVAGDEVQRRQQLGHPRGSATEHGRRRCGCLRAHEIVLSTMVCSGTSCGGCGHGGEKFGGGAGRSSAERRLWRENEAQKRGALGKELTESAGGVEVGSGKAW